VITRVKLTVNLTKQFWVTFYTILQSYTENRVSRKSWFVLNPEKKKTTDINVAGDVIIFQSLDMLPYQSKQKSNIIIAAL
jgi:hypothetical protein